MIAKVVFLFHRFMGLNVNYIYMLMLFGPWVIKMKIIIQYFSKQLNYEKLGSVIMRTDIYLFYDSVSNIFVSCWSTSS